MDFLFNFSGLPSDLDLIDEDSGDGSLTLTKIP